MRDARYLRAQAEFCLQMARQMSDPTIAENLKPRRQATMPRTAALKAGEQPQDGPIRT